MRTFFPRSPVGDDEPVDLAQVRADDALIEALRGTPLFDEPAPVPAGWLRAVPDRDAPDTVPADEFDADVAGSARSADPDTDPGAGTDTPVPGAGDARIAALLQAWRSELDAAPLPAPLDLQVAAAIVRSAPRRRRSVRPMIAVAAAIAGLLLGSTAIGARSATPDNTLLWPVTQLLWGDRVEEVKASMEAREGIDGAAKALDAGHPDQAEAALDHVTVVITKVKDSSERNTLQSDLGKVQSQLESSRASTTAQTTAGTTGAGPTAGGTTSVNPATPSPSAAPSASASASVDPPETSAAPSTDAGTPSTTPDQPTTQPTSSDVPPETTGATGSTGPETTPETPTSPAEPTTPTTTEPTVTQAPDPAAPADGAPSVGNVSPDQVTGD